MNALAKAWHAMRAYFGPYPSSDAAAMQLLFGQPPVHSGVSVSEDQALALSTVWGCVQLIAGTLGSLPLFVYRRLPGGGKEKMPSNRLYRLLHDAPNEEMTSTVFREVLQAHILLWGNGIAEITRDGSGRVAALYPIEPWRVFPFRDQRTGVLAYRVWNQISGTETMLRADQVLHIPGLGCDGIWGYSVIRKAREAVGLALATERFGAGFFGHGSTFGGILTHPARLSEAARDNLTKSIKAKHQGVDQAHDFIILEEGLKYERLGIPPEDAQFLETRRFSVEEICRLFGVPPHMVGNVERSTSWGTGIEQQNIGFVTYNLRRWLVRWEQELTRKLISPLEVQQQAIEFLVDGLLRGDTQTRYQAYATGRQWGWFSPNDIREIENMNPLPGDEGDLYLVPLNMTTPEKLAAAPAPGSGTSEPSPGSFPPEKQPAASSNGAGPSRDALEALGQELRDLLVREPGTVPDVETLLRPELRGVRDRLDALMIALGSLPAPPDLGPILDRLDSADLRAAALLELAQRPAPPDPVEALRPELEAIAGRTEPSEGMGAVLETLAADVRASLGREPDFGPLVARLEATEAAQQALRDRLAAVLPSLLALVERAAHDFVRREGDRARRAATSPEKLAAWVADFYPRQADYGVRALGPAMALYTALQGRQDGTEAEIRALVGRYVEESTKSLQGLLAAPTEDLKAAVERLADGWEAERPAALVAALLQEVVADV